MKIIKNTQEKITNMSIPGAILISGLIVGLSIFLTVWIFFGGDNNRQKLSVKNPAMNRPATQPNQMTPEQIKKIQEQRAQQAAQQITTTPKPATTTAPKAPVKK